MKKAAFFSILALCLGFTACDNYEEPNPPAQSNPQEAIFQADGVTFTPQTGTLNLGTINEEGGSAQVATVSLTDFPENYTLKLVMDVAPDNKFEKVQSLDTEINEEGVVTVNPDVFQGAINEVITKDPAALKVYTRFAAYAVNGKTEVRIGDPTTYYCAEELSVVPIAPSNLIEEGYYFMYSTDGKTWTKENSIELVQAAQGSPYDIPTFSFTYDFPVDMVADGLYWQIISLSQYQGFSSNSAGFVPGADNQDGHDGDLVAESNVNGDNSGLFFMDGMVLFTINMEERTFNYIQAIESFYTPGDANGWSFPYASLYTDDYINYKGLVSLSGSFKFSPDAGWNGRDFGQSNSSFSYKEEDGIYVGEGTAIGGDNISVPEASLYYMTMNYTTRATTLTQIVSLGMIGGFNDWGSQLAMTPNDDFTEWTVDVKFESDTEWKFRMNDNWDINLGGDVQNLTFGGDNIKTDAGSYTVKLILKGQPYAVEITKK